MNVFVRYVRMFIIDDIEHNLRDIFIFKCEHRRNIYIGNATKCVYGLLLNINTIYHLTIVALPPCIIFPNNTWRRT